MRHFHFRLEAVLMWRQQREDAERARLAGLMAKLAETQNALVRLNLELKTAMDTTIVAGSLTAFDLANLDAFHDFVGRASVQMERQIETQRKAVDEQRAAVVEAARQTKLLEKLREQQHRGWQHEAARQLESEASDLFLARWDRET